MKKVAKEKSPKEPKSLFFFNKIFQKSEKPTAKKDLTLISIKDNIINIKSVTFTSLSKVDSRFIILCFRRFLKTCIVICPLNIRDV